MRPKEAKKILPKSEYEAFESIFMNQISRTPSTRLKQRASMSRRLRDKYRDLAHRQAAEAKGNLTNETDTRLHDRRAQLFQDVIDRLEAELDQPRRQVARPPAKKKVPLKAKVENPKKVLDDAKRRTRSR